MSESGTHKLDSFSLRLFGPFDVRIGGTPIPPLRTRKGRWLLAVLVLRNGREVDREWLAGTLWPDGSEELALSNLRRTLTDLRRAMGPESWRLTSPNAHALRFIIDGGFADLIAFDEFIARGDPDSLERAVSLYNGPLLEGCGEEWIAVDRGDREEACLAALETLAAASLDRNDPAAAAIRLRRAITIDPHRESTRRALMRALAAEGNYAEMALVYRDLRERLRREMNVDPDMETIALFRELQQDARAASTAPLAALVCKDAERHPSRLPRPITTFIGREKELESIRELVATERCVTLAGPGGVGKTRLAIRAAEQAASQFADGAWFVDLASLTEPAMIPQAVARGLDLRESPGRPVLVTLLDFLSQKNLLLILDNCEHLLFACADITMRILEASPRVHLLATSRQPLGIPPERVWPASPFALPDPRHLPKTGEGQALVLPQYEAARLFVERAMEAMPTFELTEQNAAPVLRIVRLLDGLPLAIELAAARVRMLSVEQVAARLRDRFRLLTRGSPAAGPPPPRQQTLRAAIDWSFDLLSEPERALLRRLGVFSGGCTLDAVKFLYGSGASTPPRLDTTLLDLLTDLAEKSLVIADWEVRGERRYRMLETIREYGLERLADSGEEEAVRARHASWFLHLGYSAATHLSGPLESAWLDRLEADHDNLHAVLEWSLGRDRSTDAAPIVEVQHELDAQPRSMTPIEAGLEMTVRMWPYWYRRGYMREAEHWLQKALQFGADTADSGALAIVMMHAGNVANIQQRLDEAVAHYMQSLPMLRQAGNENGVASVLVNLGVVAHSQGDFPRACEYLVPAIALERRLERPVKLAIALANLGSVYHSMGDYDQALALHEECLTMFRKQGDQRGTADTLFGLAYVQMDRGDLAAARERLFESLRIRQEIGDRIGMADTLEAGACLAEARGHLPSAARLFSASVTARREIGVQDRTNLSPTMEMRLKRTREALDEAEYAAAWQEGQDLSLEESIVVVARSLSSS